MKTLKTVAKWGLFLALCVALGYFAITYTTAVQAGEALLVTLVVVGTVKKLTKKRPNDTVAKRTWNFITSFIGNVISVTGMTLIVIAMGVLLNDNSPICTMVVVLLLWYILEILLAVIGQLKLRTISH